MESKKINQLATELTPALSDLTIIGDPSTGISKKITLSQMASLFTGTVEEYASVSAFPLVGVADTIYIALDTNVLYRWNTGTNAYVELSPNIINSLVFNDANGFDGTISLVGSVATLTITTALTTGSVGFIGASGALTQDNDNFYWDNSNKRLGIGTKLPTTAIDVFGSGIIGRLNGTSTNNAFLGFASAGTNKWSIGNVQSDHRFRIYSEANTAELISVLQTGEFGIGIANPTTKLHIDGGASALIANLDANVSVAKSVSFRSDNSARFNIEVSGTESGTNAGANFFIRRYSDAGSLIDTPLTITRSTGAITLAGALGATSANFSSNVLISGNLQANGTVTIGNQFVLGTYFLNIYPTTSNSVSVQGLLSGTGAASISFQEIGGNFGIGITNPTSKLSVVGDLKIDLNTTGTSASFNGTGSSFQIKHDGTSAITLLNTGGGGYIYKASNTTTTIFSLLNTGVASFLGSLTVEGVGFIGVIPTYTNNFISFSHSARSGAGEYSFLSANDGSTIINAKTGTNIDLRINNATKVSVTSTGLTTFLGPVLGNMISWTDAASNTGYLGVRALGASIGADNNLYLQTAGITRMTISDTGNIGAPSGTNIYNASDERLKKNIQKLSYGLNEIINLNPVIFNWINGFEPTEDNKDMLGFIAQEVKNIIPEAVESFANGNTIKFKDITIKEPLRVNEKFIIPVIVKAIQELYNKIESK